MDRDALIVLQGRLQAALVAVQEAIALAGRVCFDCHRHAADLRQCADGEWRGPRCRETYEAAAGTQLPIREDA